VRELVFTRLDWLVAWRHLRAGDERPAWVIPLILASFYLMLVGGALIFHAWSLHVPDTGAEILGPFGPIVQEDLGPTPMQRYYGTFGAFTLIVGVMGFTLGMLAFVFNLLPTIITMSVLLGCMALVVVLSLMSGLEGDLREKILDQKAHIRISRSDGKPFMDYERLADELAQGDGIKGASPYLEGEIMVRSGLNRQGAILAGILPVRQTKVSNLEELVEQGEYGYLTDPASIPEADPFSLDDPGTPYRLRHLEKERDKKPAAGDSDGDGDGEGDPPTVELGVAGRELPSLAAEEGDDWEDPLEVLELEVAVDDHAPPGLVEGEDERGGEDAAGEADADAAAESGDAGAGEVDEGEREAGDGVPTIDLPKSPADLDAGNSLLRGLPSPAERLLDEVAPPDEGWEDPQAEIPRLRDEGKLPPPVEPVGEPPPEGPTQAEEPEEDEDDEPVLDPILIGRELSMELGVRLGSEVQLITPIGRTTPAGQIPGVLAARVAGVFYSGMYEYDRKNVYAPLSVVQRFLLTGDRVSGIEVALEDVDAIDAGKTEVERIVAASGRGELIVEDWRDLNRNLFSAMFLEKVAMFIALLFVVLVASFGTLASNLMSVMEKSKEIAILKAMGMTDAGIMRSFVAEGLVVGMLGSFGGIAMGLGLVAVLDRFGLPLNENVYYIEELPVVVNPEEVALVGIAALIIVCLSSIYPALVASRLRPVDALRHADA
jgi:lipoprotein-releasing system permease protein